jgi:hypothetical protein
MVFLGFFLPSRIFRLVEVKIYNCYFLVNLLDLLVKKLGLRGIKL